MRIPSNKICDVARFFRNELRDIYEKDELETFIAYCFKEYLNISRTDLVLRGNDTMSESDLLKFHLAIKDLKQYRPIQYILGKADFYGLKLIVNEHVLIPRPETEELVDLIIKSLQLKVFSLQLPEISILDIGTGSGCIAIALKKNIPQAVVYATDVSEKALEVAKTNADSNKVDIEFILDDILKSTVRLRSPQAILNPRFGFAHRKHSTFDLLVSNPPYISISEKQQMQKNVLDYEPHLALFVNNDDPLLFYKAIADFALKHLKSEGQLYFEINEHFGVEAKQMLESKGFKNVELVKDFHNKNRILKAMV